MTYPKLEALPLRIDAAARYTYESLEVSGIDIPKLFTKKDRYGEEFTMYEVDVVNAMYLVPRNCAPYCTEFDAENIYDMSYHGKVHNWDNGFCPRDEEQSRMVDESVKSLLDPEELSGHIMQAPTGYGKTYLGAAVIQQIGVRTLIITTKEDIVGDWKIALGKTLNIDDSKIGEWHGDVVPTDEHEVVVGLIQSVCKGFERYPEELYKSFGMVVVDEVQRMGAEKFGQAMWYLPARYRLGLSATPYRKDGRDELFYAHIGEVLVSTEEQTLIPKVICVDTGWEVPIVWNYQTRKKGSLVIPWDRAIIAVKYLQEDEVRNQIICDFMFSALLKGRITVILSDTVAHLQIIKDALIESGIPDEEGMFGWYCGLQSSVYKGMKDRKAVRERAKLARIALATFKMTGEGTNVPWWDTEVLATAKADVEQPVGRIRREWDGKHQPVVLDLCDSNHRVFAAFAKKRREWYESIGAEIVHKYIDKLGNLRQY